MLVAERSRDVAGGFADDLDEMGQREAKILVARRRRRASHRWSCRPPSSPCRACVRHRRGHAATYSGSALSQDLIADAGIEKLRRHHVDAPAVEQSGELAFD